MCASECVAAGMCVCVCVLCALLSVSFESCKAEVTAAAEKYDGHLQTLNKHD